MAATLRKEQQAATRAKILAAAKLAFERDGYEAATVRVIAAEAGVSTGAAYGNWPDKAEIYREIYGHAPVNPELDRRLLQALEAAPLPSSMGTAREHYERFYAWFEHTASPLIDGAKAAPAQAEAA